MSNAFVDAIVEHGLDLDAVLEKFGFLEQAWAMTNEGRCSGSRLTEATPPPVCRPSCR